MPELQLPNEVKKPWWKSKGIIGPIIALVGAIVPELQPVAEVLPEVVQPIVISIGAIVGLIGRLKAKKEVTL
jgi:hypothetical protein